MNTAEHNEQSQAIPVDPPNGQSVLFEQYSLLRKTWKWILLVAIVVSGATYFYVANYIPKEFQAVAVAVPPNKTGTPLDNVLGGISSTLKDFNIGRIIGKQSSSAGYSNLALLSSNAVKDSLIAKYNLFEVYNIPKERIDQVYGTLEGKIDINVDVEGPITISVFDTDPKRASDIANDLIAITNNLSRELNRLETEPIAKFVGQRYEQARDAQKKLSDSLQAYMQKNRIYDPESQLPIAASALLEARANEEAQRALVSVLTTTLGADDPAVLQQKGMLSHYESQRKSMEGGGDGLGPSVTGMPKAMVDYLTIRQNYEVNAKVLSLLEPLYEQTKFDIIRDIPILYMLHSATPPPVKARPRLSIALGSAFLGTFIISYLVFALVSYFKSFTHRYRQYMNAQTKISNSA